VSVGVNGIAPGAAIGMPPRRDHTMRTCTVIGARSRMRPPLATTLRMTRKPGIVPYQGIAKIAES